MFSKKDDHVNLALKFHGDEKKSDFDNLQFVYTRFPVLEIS